MTPAVNALKKAGIAFNLHEYPHDSQASSYGEEAADCLNLPTSQVFKTLIVSTHPSDNSKDLAVAIIPVSHQLNLKAVAKTLGVKKAAMADPHAAQNTTGYLLGGISPFGQKKRLSMCLDDSAEQFEKIYVSGGKRGLEIEINPQDLRKLCNARSADIKSHP